MMIVSGYNDQELFSDVPEIEFTRLTPRHQARRLGQYFTPYVVARFMAHWINQGASLKRILDPAAGLGIFFRAFLEVNPEFAGTFFGYDVDSASLAKLGEILSPHGTWKIEVELRDFLSGESPGRFDGILCNPPYLRYKAIHNRHELTARFENEHDISINRQANLYVFFILRCIQALASGGRAAILVPAEFLYSGYGTSIKEYLLNSQMLKNIVQFEGASSLFTESITTSCILLLENDNTAKPVTFLTLRSSSDLVHLTENIHRLADSNIPVAAYTPTNLDPAEKWSSYFNSSLGVDHYRHLVPFSRIGQVLRGIASGDNRFFTFDRHQIEQSGIPSASFLPCLTRSSQVMDPFFTQDAFEQLARAGKPVYLLNAAPGADHPAIQTYLKQGEASGSHLRYLTRNRRPWYRLENRSPAPILATTFNRGRLRFIRNEAGVYTLTCFHSIYLRAEMSDKVDLLMSYLLTPLANSLIQRNRREYGNGLIKYEPNDLNHALIADIDAIPRATEDKILVMYTQYRTSCLDGAPDAASLDALDCLYQEYLKK